MAAQLEHYPYDIGRVDRRWYALAGGLFVVFAWGVFAYSRDYAEGLIVTGLRTVGTMGGATWGLYVGFVVYFVGVSFAGISTAALIRLLNLRHMRPVSRIAELLTIIALLLAALMILADLGQPVRAIQNFLLYARPQSPFFGTFTLVISGYLFSSLVYFYLDGRRDAALCAQVPGRLRRFHELWAAGYRDTPAERARHVRASFFLSLAILPLLVTAHSTLGFVFGLQVGRPGWFSSLQAPGFVVLAGVSGIGLLIVIAAVVRATLHEADRLSLQVFRWLANFLMVLTAAYLYFLVVDWLTAAYQGNVHDVRVAMAILTGNFAWIYWLSVASLIAAFVVLGGQFLSNRYSLGLVVFSGAVVQVAAVGKRFLLVVPSQTEGTLLPYLPGTYGPTWIEYSVIAGLLAFGSLLYVLFLKIFPIMEVDVPEPEGRSAVQSTPSQSATADR